MAPYAATAAEPKSRIRYAEPVQLDASVVPPGVKLAPGRPAALVFDAYGRRFELELETNERLLRRLSPRRRAELPPHDVYRGRVAGLPGSWVRITRLPEGIYGAIWDGTEFYSIAPAHALAEFMGGATPATSEQALIYRASDVDLLTGLAFCTVVGTEGAVQEPATGLDQLKKLLRELSRHAVAAEAVATLELEVAMIADFEFFSAEVDPEGELLYRLNVVDGIFSEQLGVTIAATEIKVFDGPADPFTASAAQTLLGQVGNYRAATPSIAATGLAHLVTGRDLLGDTVGIAYLAGVCEAEIGVSLSERFFDPFLSALIAAHEFGHNLGAPHDSEIGSPCRTTPTGFLMEPTLNGSTTFSQCSLDQMAPVIAASSCIKVRQYVDVGIESAPSKLVGHTRIAERLSFDVTSVGTLVASGVSVNVQVDSSISAAVVRVEDGTCALTSGGLTCQLDSITAGERRRIEIDLTGSNVSLTPGSISVTANDDVNASNDDHRFELSLSPATDASIRAEPQAIAVLSGEEFTAIYFVSVVGVLPLSSATVETFASGGLQILSAAAESGACNVTASSTTCDLGSVAPGGTRRVTLRVRGSTAGRSFNVVHHLHGTTDDTDYNNLAENAVRVDPLVDLVVRAEPSSEQVQRGATVTRSFTILSIGPREAREARVRVSWPITLDMGEVLAAGATCRVLGENSRECLFSAPIESDGTRRVDLTFVAARIGSGSLIANVSSPDNQHIDGPLRTSAGIEVDVRELTDVAISTGIDEVSTYDSVPIRVHWRVASLGLTNADAAHLELSLPTEITASSVESTLGDCIVSDSSVRCDFGPLTSNGPADVTMILQATLPGSYVLSGEAGAANDADPSNNLTAIHLNIHANIDVSVDPLPDVVKAKIGRTVRYTVTVSTASHAVNGVVFGTLTEPTSDQYEILSVSPSLGTCHIQDGNANCMIGTVPPRTTVAIDFELRGLEIGMARIHVYVEGENVINLGNNSGFGTLVVAPIGNVTVSASPDRLERAVDESFAAPSITVTSLLETESVSLRISVPEGLVIESGVPDIGICEVAPSAVDCTFGTLVTGEQRSVDLRLHAARAGTFTTQLQVQTDDDSDPSDNATTFVVEAIDRESPASPSGGGGGGGSFDWTSLLVGTAALALRRRRIVNTERYTAGQVHSGTCPHGSAHC